jgi:hypothetical protein
MLPAEEVVIGAQTEADGFVTARFLEAQEYARNSWEEANAYLGQLVTAVAHPAVDTSVVVPFDYSGDDIVISSHGTKPVKPEFNTTMPSPKPYLGTLKPLPEFNFLTADLDTLRNSIISRLQEVITDGATGLDPVVEQAIWDRARGRQELENIRMYNEAEQYFSSRGFVLPTGALANRLQEISIEVARNNANLNNDILTKQAELAQTNFQFAAEKGAAVVVQLTELSIKSVLDYNKGTVESFMASVEAYKQEISSVLSLLEAQTKVYTAEADVYKSGALVDNADIAAQVEIAKISLQEASLRAELELKRVSTELEAAMKLHQLQVLAYESGSKVTSQIVASALSAVNASANYGFSGNASMGTAYSYDLTKGVKTNSESTVHTYSENVNI